MTIEVFARRIAASLGVCGVVLLIAATIVWSTVGTGDETLHSIHNVPGWVAAVFGVVLLAASLTLSARVLEPPVASRTGIPASEPEDGTNPGS